MANNDKKVVEQLLEEKYGDWISDVRELLCQEDSPLSLRNGTWSVAKRREMWQELGPYLFDEHLDKFRHIAVEVLREPDPQFELEPDKRYMANIHGKILKYSDTLRKGLAETLALLGTQPEALEKCSSGKAESTAVLAIRNILDNADSVLWGSLNSLLPTLAEAAPLEFLNAIENALKKTPCPFDELFTQEGNGLTGRNYMTGLLWALENLAWDPDYLVQVTVILGKLDSRDPGGNWANRPANSLTTIFLPWIPQTIASVEKRKVAVQTLLKEFPNVAWKLLLNLLPNRCLSSSGSHKPEWRKIIPDGWEKGVTNKEYWEQIVNYSDMAVETAKSDITKLKELVVHLQNLAEPSFYALLGYLKTEEVKKIPEEERTALWEALNKIIIRQKWHSSKKDAFTPEIVQRIEQIAEDIRAKNPQNRYRYLFGNSVELYEERGNYAEQEKKLEDQRQKAIKEILKEGGFKAVLQFAQDVEASRSVGYSLGVVSESDVDRFVLPDFLGAEDGKIKEFAELFVFAKYKTRGREWVDQLDTEKWSKEKIGIFLSHLPSAKETWDYVTKLLGEHEVEYWKRVPAYPYEEDNLDYAIAKLIEHKRPNAAITCLYLGLHKQKLLNKDLAIKALLDARSTKESPNNMFDAYHTAEVIKALQDNPETNEADLFQIEWAYLPILTGPGKNASPKLLEQKLASEPDFFCELIQRLYRSKNETESPKESTEQQKIIAQNAWRLFEDWSILPGTLRDENFSADNFNIWLEHVKTKCEQSGHLEVAMITVGKVLMHYIPDPDGFWIHNAIAEALNAEDADDIRHGFYIEILNSRGAHFVDPTGKPEKELAAKYRKQADEVENASYYRLAKTFRDLADSYEHEAQRIIDNIKSFSAQ